MPNELANTATSPALNPSIPVVGIGADAGGLAALARFLRGIPPNAGMAFVVVLQGASTGKRPLAMRLQPSTPLPVTIVEDGMAVELNHVYIAPARHRLTLTNHRLQLTTLMRARGRHLRIDHFLQSLADARGASAIGILLSGQGDDGIEGLKAIKAQVGLTLVQAPDEADYPALPRRAIDLGLVDWVAPAGELAQKLSKLVQDIPLPGARETPTDEVVLSEADGAAISGILAQLRTQTGHDLNHYKRSTILRRIARRLQMNSIASLGEYLDYLHQQPEETQALFKDCLISVTHFFRDPEAFDLLEKEVIPRLLAGKKSTDTVRVWVAGCATGEEAYSVAILLLESIGQRAALGIESPRLQLFATDIDEEAIAFARRGLYANVLTMQIPPARLQRFFSQENEGYRVKLELRELVLFAVHNLLKDPPFSKLDLITCRNVLIYFNREAQEKTFDIFHYALNPEGYLFLGTSERADTFATLFSITDKHYHFFQRQTTLAAPQRLPTTAIAEGNSKLSGQTARPTKPKAQSIEELYQQWTLRHYAPPRVLVNENYEVTHIFNGADRYLRERDGAVMQNILLKVLPELRLDLRAALYQALNKGERTDSRLLRVQLDHESCLIQLHVGPVPEPGFPKDYLEVVFEERQETAIVGLPAPESTAETDNALTSRLEDELLRTRERLQTIIEEHEISNQDLKASNEELQSINEELKSTTEELETSKEELQSMNEELATVNQELKLKIDELSGVNSDLLNLIASTDVGAVFLDQRLRLKRFTPRATELFYLIDTDIGRPFVHVTHRIQPGTASLSEARLVELAARVLNTLEAIEDLVQSDDERWYILRLFPYLTVSNLVEGVVITFVDITDLKRAEHETKQRIQQQTVAELGRQALQERDLAALMATATQRVAEVLQVEFAKVLEAQADGQTLHFKTGVGWSPEIVHEVALLTPENTQSWYTFHEDKPVIVENLQQEKRFQPSPMLSAHRVVSGVTVVIPSRDGLYGVLGAYSQQPRAFTRYEVDFLQAVANLLAEALARQAVEEDLRVSETRYRQLVDAMPQIVWISDPTGELRYVNQGWLNYSGTTIADNLQHGVWSAVHPNDIIINRAAWGQALQTGIGYEDELRLRARNGVYRWFLERGVPVRDANGVVIEWYTTATDIDERKRAELNQQFLTALDTQLRPVTDPDLIRQIAVQALGVHLQVDRCTLNEVDADSTRLIVPAHYRQPGVASVEGVHYLSDLVDVATLDESRAGRAVMFSDTQTDVRSAAQYATGYQLRNIRALIAVPCMQAGRWVALLSVHSTTPRTWQPEEIGLLEAVAARIWPAIVKARAEQALRQKEEQVRLITDNVQGLIAYIDREERYQFVNAAYESWYERPRTQILGHKLSEFIRARTYAQAKSYIAAALAGHAVSFEVETSRAGKRVDWLMKYTPHIATDGEVLGFYTLITDITERKQVEEQLRYHAHLLDNIEDAVVATDANLRVTAWNRGAEKIYGWQAHEVLGQPLPQVINSNLTQEQRSELLQEMKKSGVSNLEVMYHHDKAGKPLQLEASTIPLYGSDNQLMGYLSINRDIHARKQAEQQINFQARLLDVVEQAVIAIDLTGNIIYWNGFAEQLYGWRADEVKGRSAAEVIRNTTTAEQATEMATQFRNGKSWAGEFMVYRRNGTAFPAQVLNSPIYAENGILLGFVGVSVDITERKAAEKALHQQANMLENTHDAIFMWGLGGAIVYWNRGAEQLYGYTKAEVIGQSSHTLLRTVHPHSLQTFEYLLQHEKEWTGELQHVTKDGRMLTVLSRHQLLREADGNTYVLETSHDITERKQAEETIRRQLNEIEAIYATTPVGLCMVDAQLRYVRINEALAELNGSPVASYIGRTLRETGTADSAALVEPLYRHVLATGEPILNREIHGATATEPERERDWLVSYYPLTNAGGSVAGVNAVVVEITERKRDERKLREFSERLEQRVVERTAELAQRNRELDQFAYVASHDLRSPLRAIDHLANWITQDANDFLPAPSKEHLHKLRGRVKRLEKLLDDLLAYSRADRYHYPVERVDTGALVSDIVRLLAPPEDFTITIQPNMPVLTTARVPLELVLRNLINNAIKHHHRPNGQIEVTAYDQDDFIEFVITDDGPGIAAEFHERIFQMFQTLQPRDKVEGSGIGLAIVKKVVENRGGVVRLNSVAQDGASFHFTWPK